MAPRTQPSTALPPHTRHASLLAAHVNDAGPGHLERMAAAGVSVAYCPRANAYFGHPRGRDGGHQYREMLEAGVNVALGTDSMICLDTPDRISVLDEMRLLHQRDGADPLTLLRMATINGARALGFDDGIVRLRPGMSAGLLALAASGSTPAQMLADSLLRPTHRPVRCADGPIVGGWVLGPVDGSRLERFHHLP